jgi:multidrug efflux pump subunit AcrB
MIRTHWSLGFALVPLFLGSGCGADPPASSPDKDEPLVIMVEASYPGANAQVVADTVAAPIEQQVNGVEGMRYLRSRCASDGTYRLAVVFTPGAKPDLTQVLVQNRVSLAVPQLPDVVNRSGITVKKKSLCPLLLVKLSSPDDRFDSLYLSNYATIQIKDELARLAGAGDVVLFGQRDYALRIWLDPEKLASRNLTAGDVSEALKEQNAQVAAGAIGKPPAPKDQGFQLTINGLGRLTDPDQLGNVILKTDGQGRKVRLKDVARVELGAAGREHYALANGKGAAVLGVYPLPRANAQELSAAVRKTVAALRERLPEGLALDVTFDFTPGRPSAAEHLLLEPRLPDGASVTRMIAVLRRSGALLRKIDGVEDVLALSENPFDFCGERACLLVRLAAAAKRQASRQEIMQTIRKRLAEIQEMTLRLRDLSAASFPHGGYPIDLAIHGPEGDPVRRLADKLAERLGESKKLTDVWASRDSAPQPQLYLDINREQAAQLGVKVGDINNTLQVYLGELYVNDFNRFGRTWQVVVQADAKFRNQAEAIGKLQVRNNRGDLVPLAKLVQVRNVQGPPVIDRLDGRPMVEITANPAAGVPLAEIRTLCENLAQETRRELRLPAEYRLTWLAELPASR